MPPVTDRSPGSQTGSQLLVCASCRDACPLGPVDLEAAVNGGGDGLQVVWVRADHEVVAAYGSLHHARVDNVGGGGAGGERADSAGLAIIEGLHMAAGPAGPGGFLRATTVPGRVRAPWALHGASAGHGGGPRCGVLPGRARSRLIGRRILLIEVADTPDLEVLRTCAKGRVGLNDLARGCCQTVPAARLYRTCR